MIVSTGRGNIHPVSIAGIIGPASVGADGAHCDCLRILGRRTPRLIVVAGGEETDTAGHGTDLLAIGVHAGILVKVIDGRLQGRSIFPGIRLQEKLVAFPGILVAVGTVVIAEIIAPAVIAEDSTMIRSPFDGVFETAAALVREDLAGNQADTRNPFCGVSAGQTGDTDAVVVDGPDDTGHMGAMVVRRDVGAFGGEIVAVGRIGVSDQIFMIQLDTAVHDRDTDGRTARRIILPDRNDLHVGSSHPGGVGSFIVVLPLGAEFRVIEGIAHPLGLDDRFIGDDAFHLAEDIRRLVFPDGGTEMDPIPAVKSHFPRARFEFAGIRENPFQAGHADLADGLVERGGGPGRRHALFDPSNGLFIQQDVRRSGDIDAFRFLFLGSDSGCDFGFHFLLTAGQEEKRQGPSEGNQSVLHGSRVGFQSENQPLPSRTPVVTI